MSDQIQLAFPAITSLDPGSSGWNILAPMAMEETRKHTDKEYCNQLKILNVIGKGSQAWTGDVYNSMRSNGSHGRAEIIAEEAGFEKRTIQTYGYVCKAVKITIRIVISTKFPKLKFHHFQVVAPLECRKQIGWLNRAGRKDWSVSQLRTALRFNKSEWLPRAFNNWPPFIIEEWQQKYPGQLPGEILRNILFFTTDNGDKVIDVFGGGGNMKLAAEDMDRLCISYDIDPQYPGIIRHNALNIFPDSEAKLVFLDPPYWSQKKGEYRSDPDDLSNMDLVPFYLAMEKIVDNAYVALARNGYCVLIIGATQADGEYYDHALEIYSRIKSNWRIVNRVSGAYPTSQYTGNDVKRAIQNKQMLNLYTTILFLQKA